MASSTSTTILTDRGSAVIAVTYVFIVTTLIFVVLRVGTIFIRRKKLGLDDGLLVLASCLGLVSAVCIANAVSNGLGRPIAMVQSGQLGRYFKLSYASNVFLILAMAASKHSSAALISRLTPPKSDKRRRALLFHPVIGAWTLFSTFGILFECNFPMPWIYLPSRCSGHGAVWYPIVVFSILTDVALASGFVLVVQGVQLDSKKQIKIAAIFLSRIIVAILSIVYIALLAPALKSSDQTWVIVVPSTIAQVMMNLSILTAGLPALFPKLISIEAVTPAVVVSEITAVNINPSHSRATSDERNRLRDWAFAQLRNSPSPNSFMKDASIDTTTTTTTTDLPKYRSGVVVDDIDSNTTTLAPAIPPRSEKRRSLSPNLSLNAVSRSPIADVEKAWFVDDRPRQSIRTSKITEEPDQI